MFNDVASISKLIIGWESVLIVSDLILYQSKDDIFPSLFELSGVEDFCLFLDGLDKEFDAVSTGW